VLISHYLLIHFILIPGPWLG